jgi:hypothetical protein
MKLLSIGRFKDGFRDVTYFGGSYVQCERCKGFGRPRWAHMCKPEERATSPHGNWHASPTMLEQARA